MRGWRGISAVTIVQLLALVVVVGVIAVVVVPRLSGAARPDAGATPAPSWAPAPLVEPVETTATPAGSHPLDIATLVDPSWASRVAAATGIPDPAVLAYAGAALRKAQLTPACKLSWTTLAAIGKVESDHGRDGGSSIGADGTVTPPIYGVALNGKGVALIRDSDGGAIDGDAAADRAVGPMQLIPQTWRNWHADGNGDGVEDPQNIDDAVMATTNYLCRASTALDTESGWRAAISAYNSPESYLALVAQWAVRYNALAAAAR